MVEKTEYLSDKTTPEAQFQLVSEINTLFYISLITIAVVVNYDWNQDGILISLKLIIPDDIKIMNVTLKKNLVQAL